MRYALKFYGLGLIVAGLEEFISQGVLKNDFGGWIIPTIIAFLPFLIIVRTIGNVLDRYLSEHKAAWICYLISGGIGLAVEWFLIGLSPWRDPDAHPLGVLGLQIGMFSFWCGVAFTPRLLLDKRKIVSRVRTGFKWFWIAGMSVIYIVTFTVPKKAQFAAGIISVILTFVIMNLFYFNYLQRLKKIDERPD
jgi:hypothetical protein